MPRFEVFGQVKLWHDFRMEVEAKDEVEAERKAKTLDFIEFDFDPPNTVTKDWDVDLSTVDKL